MINTKTNIFNKVFGDFFEFSWDIFKVIFVVWLIALTVAIYIVTFVSFPIMSVAASELTFWENISRIFYSILEMAWWVYFLVPLGGATLLSLLTYNFLFNTVVGVFK